MERGKLPVLALLERLDVELWLERLRTTPPWTDGPEAGDSSDLARLSPGSETETTLLTKIWRYSAFR